MLNHINNDDSEEVLVEFIWNEEGEEVLIAGSFLNKWQKKLKMEKRDGAFHLSLVASKETASRQVLLQVHSGRSVEMPP